MACDRSFPYNEIAELLLTNKPLTANLNALDKYGHTSVFHCCQQNNVHTLQVLLQYELHGQICDINIPKLSNQQSCLYVACDRGYKEIVKLLLEYKYVSVNVDAVDNNKGFTPLMRAAMRDHSEIIRMLLANGANINQVNNWGRNSLMLGAKAHNDKICKILLNNEENGAQHEMVDLWVTDTKGRDIFHYITHHMDQRIVKQIRTLLHATITSAIHHCRSNFPNRVIRAICVATY
jgi:ankyrin repeat protein